MARRATLAVSSPNISRRPIAATMSVVGDRGRSTDELQKVRADIGAPNDLPLVKADACRAGQPAFDVRACGRDHHDGRGYQLHGPELVASCAATGTAYVDLCGEPAWMRRMIHAHHEEAKRTGARIVFPVASIPSRSISACPRCRRRRARNSDARRGGSKPACASERGHVWRHRASARATWPPPRRDWP